MSDLIAAFLYVWGENADLCKYPVKNLAGTRPGFPAGPPAGMCLWTTPGPGWDFPSSAKKNPSLTNNVVSEGLYIF